MSGKSRLRTTMLPAVTAKVTVRASPAAAVIVVEDRHRGMLAANRQSLFEPFDRLDQSRGRESGRIGLGLAIARAAGLVHGGDTALSDQPKGGLRAELHLMLGGA